MKISKLYFCDLLLTIAYILKQKPKQMRTSIFLSIFLSLSIKISFARIKFLNNVKGEIAICFWLNLFCFSDTSVGIRLPLTASVKI